MNQQLELKLRQKVRKIVESIMNEDTPMSPADDFKPKVKFKKSVIGRDITIENNGDDTYSISNKRDNTTVTLSRKDTEELGRFIIRVLGKV